MPARQGKARQGKARHIIVLSVSIGLLISWIIPIDDSPITHDAVATLIMGINLSHQGVLSHLIEPPFLPTMYREPLPAIVNAFVIEILDLVLGPADGIEYFSGHHAMFLKYQNVLWALITTLSTLGLLNTLTRSFWFSLLGAVLVNFNIPFINNVDYNTLYSEPASKALFVLSIYLLTLSFYKKSRFILIAAGICFGLLALTKAIFLYVVIGLTLSMPAVHLMFSKNNHKGFPISKVKKSTVNALCFILAFSFIVAPWILRNYNCCNQLSISERSGIIMMQRATLNEVNPTEYAGLFYRFSPPVLSSFIGNLLDFEESDFQRGGKLQRISFGLNTEFHEEDLAAEISGQPDKTITYYRNARAIRTDLVNKFQNAGFERPLSMADSELKNQALNLIMTNPGQHIAFILPALWRGSFIGAPVLILLLFYAFLKKREDLALMILPALGMVLLYALFTPFLYRFGTTIMPIILILIMTFLHIQWSNLIGQRNLGQVKRKSEFESELNP